MIFQHDLHKHFGAQQFTRLFILGIFIILGIIPDLKAQDNSLRRVTSAKRSDGKGQVIRFQLAQAVDSFRVYQPDADLVQMTLYGQKLDTTGIEVPNSTPAFDEISFYKVPAGIGVDVYIPQDKAFKATAYGDARSDDLLMALTKTDKTELEYLTKDKDPIIWSRYAVKEESLLVGGLDSQDMLTNPNSIYNEYKDRMKFDVVVLDPGHGGHDPGAPGYKGVKEKDVVLDIAKKVGGYINKYMPDVKVVYTRDDDSFVELEERGSIANRNEGDLFVSIHCNSNHSRQPYGTEVYFLGLERSNTALEVMKRENKVVRSNNESEQKKLSQEELLVYELANSGYIATSERIAGMIEHQLDDRAQRRSRGVKQARFVVLYHASMPAILVETGFITNPSEERYLTSDYGQSIIASAIFRAIRNYKEDYEKSQQLNAK